MFALTIPNFQVIWIGSDTVTNWISILRTLELTHKIDSQLHDRRIGESVAKLCIHLTGRGVHVAQ